MSPGASGFHVSWAGGPVSLQVLEMCVNHCGEKFHSEVAKFRFLNELIKVLSPKVSAQGRPCSLRRSPASFQAPVSLLGPEMGLLGAEAAHLSQGCES